MSHPSFSHIKEHQHIVQVPEHLFCEICTEVIQGPQSLACGHTLCLLCVERILETTPADDDAVCPLCRQPCEPYVRNFFAEKCVNVLPVYCLHRFKHSSEEPDTVDGCQAQLTLGTFEEHQAQCPHRWVACPYAGCHEATRFLNLDNHKRSCEHRFIKCPKCHSKLEPDTLDAHVAESCPSAIIQCPHEGCSVRMIRRSMQAHVKSSCPFRPYQCPHKSKTSNQKCAFQGTFQAVQQHLPNCRMNRVRCRGCNSYVQFLDVDAHQESCGHLQLNCPMSSFGCRFKGSERDLRDHMAMSVQEHKALRFVDYEAPERQPFVFRPPQSAGTSEASFPIFVKDLHGVTTTFMVTHSTTAGDVLTKVGQADVMHLAFKTKLLKKEDKVLAAGVRRDSTLFVRCKSVFAAPEKQPQGLESPVPGQLNDVNM